MRLALLILPLAVMPAFSQTAGNMPFQFDAETLSAVIRHMQPATVDALLTELATADRMRQLEILDEMPMRTPNADSSDQHRLVWALRDLAASLQAAPEVRARALVALGKCERWMSDSSAMREAIEALEAEAATRDANRLPLQVYALEGLVNAADKLPFGDPAVAEKLAETALGALRDQRPALERQLAVQALSKEFGAYSVRALWQRVGSEIQVQVVQPAEGEYWNDSRNTVAVRYFWMNCLSRIAWGTPEPGVRERVKTIFRSLRDREPDTQLRQVARLYAQQLGA
jgi:hypothetical protein